MTNLDLLDKRLLRQQLIQTRQQLSLTDWQQKSDRICQNLISSPQFQQAQTVLAYFSVRQEPDLGRLFDEFPARNWGFPRCQGQSLHWHHWSPSDRYALVTNRFGILEPDLRQSVIDVASVDLVLVPAVACDYQGFRLGYGGGFYDRLLSQPEWQTKPTIGIVFQEALLPQLPVQPWDERLTAVCTDSAYVMISED